MKCKEYHVITRIEWEFAETLEIISNIKSEDRAVTFLCQVENKLARLCDIIKVKSNVQMFLLPDDRGREK